MDFSKLLQALANAVEAADGDALANCFTPDGVYEDYFFGRKEGRQGIKEMLAHFHQGGTDFRWEFFDPVCDARRGYARYRFSYDSLRPEARGQRVGFDGIACFDLHDGLISHYREVFDRGLALAQQNFSPEHMVRIEIKYAEALRLSPDWHLHFQSQV